VSQILLEASAASASSILGIMQTGSSQETSRMVKESCQRSNSTNPPCGCSWDSKKEVTHTHTPAEADDSGKGATTCKKQHPPTNFKRKRADLSSSGSSSMSDSEAVKDDQLSVGEGRSKAASMGVSRGRGKRGRGGRRVGERGRGGAGRGGRGRGRGERGMRNKTMKVTTANIGSLEFSASSSSSDSEFDSIVKSLEGEELELLGDYTEHEVGPPVQEKDRVEETVCGKGKFLHRKLQRGRKRRKI